MIKRTIISILGEPNGVLYLKKGFDKALKNIPAVCEDLLRFAWKRLKIALVVQTIT